MRYHSVLGIRNHGNSALPSSFRPSYTSSSQARRCLASSSPSSQREIASTLITFDDWDRGKIFDWYRGLSHTSVNRMELWKERDDFKHEFVVVYMDEDITMRIERRPLGGPSPEAILAKGCKAEDTITVVTNDELVVIRSEADVQLTMDFNAKKKPDLYAVIAICVATQMDGECKNYTLQQYNCYFLARTIVTLTIRHYLLISLGDLRWDSIAAPAVKSYVSGGNRGVLEKATRNGITAALEGMLWPFIKSDAETLIDKQKDWTELRKLTKDVIDEATMNVTQLSVDSVLNGFVEWILDATRTTLWRGNLEKNVSQSSYKHAFEQATEDALVTHASPELQSKLPRQLILKFEDILPKRLVARIPPHVLARLPTELLARVSARVANKVPDEFILGAPADIFGRIPAEMFQRFPDEVFLRARDDIIFTCPEIIARLPDRLIKIALQRLQALLDQPSDYPHRHLALNFLSHLPDDILGELPPKYRDLIAVPSECPLSTASPAVDSAGTPSTSANEDPLSSGPPPRKRRFSILGLVVCAIPRPIFERLPCMLSLVPVSWLKTVPPEAIEKLPPKYIARIPSRCLARLPIEFLENVPAHVFQIIPRITIERTPVSLLEKMSTQVLSRLPMELVENLPENLSDSLQQALGAEAFRDKNMKDEVMVQVNELVEQMLREIPDNLPQNVIRVFIRSRSQIKAMEEMKIVERHQDLQDYILDMITRHSKKVSKVARLGLGEQAVYSGLRDKMEAIWRVMRLHTTPPHRFARILG